MSNNLYDVLQVSQNAGVDIIEAAYKLKKSKLERNGDLDSQNELKIALWAYQTLIDLDKRAAYDNQLPKIDVPYISTENHDAPTIQPGIFMDWWSSYKVTAIITVVAVLVGANIYFDYRKEAQKNDVLKKAVEGSENNLSKHFDNEKIMVTGAVSNEGKAIDVVSSIAQQEQDRRRTELEYRANAGGQILEMQRQQQEQQLEMQRQRQEALLKNQQQLIEQQRIQREQRYYSCYNAAWDRFQGDGARAAAHCISYK